MMIDEASDVSNRSSAIRPGILRFLNKFDLGPQKLARIQGC
jgi:hypothetical protein